MASVWALPLATTLSSLAAAALMLRSLRHTSPPLRAPQPQADLDEQLSHCLAHLRDLRDQAPRLLPEVYAEETQRFEALAAQLLRQREEAPAPAPGRRMPPPPTPTVQFLAQRPALRALLWTAGSLAVVGLLSVLVWQEQKPRLDAAQAPPPMAQADDQSAEVRGLMENLQKSPNDVPMLLRLAHILLRGQMLEQAKTVNDRALTLEPQSVEGQVHAAVLVAAAGKSTEANRALDTLTSAHGGFSEAWFFRGMLAMQAGDKPRMIDSFKHFVTVAPPGPQRDRVEAMLQNATQP